MLAEGFDTDRLLHGGAVPYTAADGLVALAPAADPDGLTGAVADAARAAGMAVTELAAPPGLAPLDQPEQQRAGSGLPDLQPLHNL